MGEERPLGSELPDWRPPPRPDGLTLSGTFATLEPLDPERHAADLFRAYEGADHVWDYMPVGPFASAATFHRWMRDAVERRDAVFFAIRNREADEVQGYCALLNIAPANGSIEVGFIAYSPALQRTRAATDAQYLLMRWAFEAGYRRYEWKCNALNQPSRRAAERLGFSYEGVFRQHMVVKGRNRDTAWFAAIDSEWPALKEAFEAWLAPSNFDDQGQQRERLGDLTALVRTSSDPSLRRAPRSAP